MSSVPAAKDISELYLLDPANFVANLERARARGVPFTALQADRRDRDRAESAAGCAELAAQPRILDVFYETLGEIGHVGEAVTAAILYLAVVSRLLAKPVSVVVKGPSAAGKSYTVETTLAFFTPSRLPRAVGDERTRGDLRARVARSSHVRALRGRRPQQ
jgi:hypothetical protein